VSDCMNIISVIVWSKKEGRYHDILFLKWKKKKKTDF
jgi:hypothetical protein